jgi:hypothetical protein
MEFGSSIAGAAAGGCACVVRVIEGRCIAPLAAPGSGGADACGRPVSVIKRAVVARVYMRRGNGVTGRGARCGGT